MQTAAGADPGGPRVRRGPGRGRRRLRRGPLRPRAARLHRADPRRGGRRRAAGVRGGHGASRTGPASRCASCSPRCATRPAPARSPSCRSPGATAGWPASTSPAPRPATRPPATSTPSSTSSARTRHFTIHAGEAFGLPSIWEAIQWCGADRLGHGVRIIDDITVADDGVGRAGPAGGVRPGHADPARDVPGLQRADRRRRRRSPSTRSGCSPGSGSGSRSTPTTG